ncbi:hypothetical protein [Hyphomonas sp.]|uniref:hypothetical protein n=1 Tax=Hyphomonas sp. TaxID=87 RepID=UPI00356412CE
MTRTVLPEEARRRTSPDEADQIETAARRRRKQMLPGEGPHAPDKDVPVDHFKGSDETIILGPAPDVASYTTPEVHDELAATPDKGEHKATGTYQTPSPD